MEGSRGDQIQRLYFSMSEVCQLIRVKPHVLRYWEKEFPLLKPLKDRRGRRRYRQADINLISEIKKLLYEDGYTIDGARQRMDAVAKGQAIPRDMKELRGIISEIELKLQEMSDILKEDAE